MEDEIIKIYGNRVRIRVCGVCWVDKRLLLVNHHSITQSDFWAPPGGGMEFGSTISKNLEREFLEETGLEIAVEKFIFGCEFLKEPLHCIELFFQASVRGGRLRVGNDPELPIIKDVRFFSESELGEIPVANLHGILALAKTESDFQNLSGFYTI
jgi:8-oxo-dGTP diphosphatase